MSLTVFCLCAEWCGTCRDFRASFDEVSAKRAADQCRWVDIEVHDELLAHLDIEIESLPTLIILDDDSEVRFAGPIAPFLEVAMRLCRSADEGVLLADPGDALVSRAPALVLALTGG
ncbi:thioredoxin family protein [Methyloversatilis sp.]|uniref:thioredoxin family protein n=1 Tax=Methyloversatilis sp. TaxID=2569862 RepID=UPI003D2E7719